MAKFLLIVDLPNPRIEHAAIKACIEDWSTSKPMLLFQVESKIAYMFSTERKMSEMNVSGLMFNEDSFLLIELGSRHYGEGFRLEMQRTWLTLHHHQ